MSVTTEGIGGWLVSLGRRRAGLVLVLAYTVAVFSAGATSVLWWSEFRTWGDRISSLEVRMDNYADSLAVPAIQRIERLEQRQDEFRRMWDREWESEGRFQVMAVQTHQMYCDRWPDRCVPVPR